MKIKNGTHTIQSPRGGHRTFRIATQPDDAEFAPGQRIVSLLCGPDNETSYVGFGFVSSYADRGVELVKLWRRFLSKPGEPSSDFEWYADMLMNSQKYEASGYRYLCEARCIRCNRKLTTPVSINLGVGPDCAALMGLSPKTVLNLDKVKTQRLPTTLKEVP